jgi:hypothetical protein
MSLELEFAIKDEKKLQKIHKGESNSGIDFLLFVALDEFTFPHQMCTQKTMN